MNDKSGYHLNKLTILIIAAAVVVVALLFLSPARSASTSPCSACHAAQGYSQTVNFLEANAGNQLPTTINVGETKTVTVVIQNLVAKAPINTGLSSASVTLKSQSGHFSISAATYTIGDFPAGTATATWQITGVTAGADTLVMTFSASNPHMSLSFTDTFAPSPSITVSAPSPTPAPPTPTPTPTAAPSPSPTTGTSATPLSTPTPTSSPASSSSPSPMPSPTLIPGSSSSPVPTSSVGQTPNQSPSSSPLVTSLPSGSTSSTPNPSSVPTPESSGSLPISVTLSSPAGGEEWWAYTRQMIAWSVSGGSGSLSVDLEYSPSGDRGPWTTIATNLTNVESFSWTVPNIRSNDCYIRVSVTDSANPTQIISSVSVVPFSVVGPQQSSTEAVIALVILLPMTLVIAFVIGKETAKRRLMRVVEAPKRFGGGIGVGTMKQQNAQISAGKQQGVGIETGLVMDPQNKHPGEPNSAIDHEFTAEVINTLRDLAKEGSTVVIFSQKHPHAVTINRRAPQRIMKHIKSDPGEEKSKPRRSVRKVKSAKRK